MVVAVANPDQTQTSRETTAVVLLTAGSLLPVIGWAAGVVVLWSSRLFAIPEKIVATLFLPGGLFAGWVLASSITGFTATSCSGAFASACPVPPRIGGLAGLLLVAVLLALSVSGPAWAWRRMRGRFAR